VCVGRSVQPLPNDFGLLFSECLACVLTKLMLILIGKLALQVLQCVGLSANLQYIGRLSEF